MPLQKLRSLISYFILMTVSIFLGTTVAVTVAAKQRDNYKGEVIVQPLGPTGQTNDLIGPIRAGVYASQKTRSVCSFTEQLLPARLRIEEIGKSGLVQFIIQDTRPDYIKDCLRSLAEDFIDAQSRTREELLAELNARISMIKTDQKSLTFVNEKLVERTELFDSAEKFSASLQVLLGLRGQLNSMSAELARLQSQVRQLESQSFVRSNIRLTSLGPPLSAGSLYALGTFIAFLCAISCYFFIMYIWVPLRDVLLRKPYPH